MRTVVFALPGNEALALSLATRLGADLGLSEVRHFPDGDSYVRIDSDVVGATVILACTLDRADAKFLPLSLLAATARELGAVRVGLVCPYLAYMRQDTRFHPGEAISSVYFAKLLSDMVDWLVTVDPHLHRHNSLDEIFRIPAVAVHAAPHLASWLRENVAEPVLVGPDRESEQWVASVAEVARAPYVVLEKIRRGDRIVELSAPDFPEQRGQTPVLIDDIISTGGTMAETIGLLLKTGHRPPVCVGVHAVFASDAYTALRAAGSAKIVTCNTIPHESNAIDVIPAVADTIRKILGVGHVA